MLPKRFFHLWYFFFFQPLIARSRSQKKIHLKILIINFLALFIQLVADHDMSVAFKASKCLTTGGDTKASAHWDGIRYLNEHDCGDTVSNLEASEV
jgi:hypothetical protein